MTDPYTTGTEARRQYARSPQFAQFARNLRGEDGAKLFLPPVSQDNMMVSRPLPKAYAEWIRGWDDEMGREQLDGT